MSQHAGRLLSAIVECKKRPLSLSLSKSVSIANNKQEYAFDTGRPCDTGTRQIEKLVVFDVCSSGIVMMDTTKYPGKGLRVTRRLWSVVTSSGFD